MNAAAVGTHLLGRVGLLAANRSRLATQQGVVTMAMVKAGVTAAALDATVYARMLGQKASEETDVPVESATEPSDSTPEDAAKAQQQLSALQWAIPALTGLLIVVKRIRRRAAATGRGAPRARQPLELTGRRRRRPRGAPRDHSVAGCFVWPRPGAGSASDHASNTCAIWAVKASLEGVFTRTYVRIGQAFEPLEAKAGRTVGSRT